MEDPGPNVLLVVLDSVRARNCGIHGHDNETTPFLSSFADDATVFRQARAPGIHSVASHASIFTGYHVEEHGVTEHESSLDPAATVWADLSAEHGYETGLFTPNVIVTESSNLAEPFDAVVGPRRDTTDKVFDRATSPAEIPRELSPVGYFREAIAHDRPIRSLLNGVYDQLTTTTSHDPESEHASVYVQEFLEWIGDGRSNPWAVCLNLMDAHYPFVPDPEHDRWAGAPIRAIQDDLLGGPLARDFLRDRPYGQLRALESLYDGCIHQLDAELEQLVAALTERGVLDDTLLVITSDHGEAFGERSRVTPATRYVGHSWGIGEVQTHVPLLVRQPEYTGGAVDSPATLTGFPDAVRAAIAGDDVRGAFVPDTKPVVSSTYRIRPPGDELPVADADRGRFLGPWRAVYRDFDEGVTKFVRHHDDAVTLRVLDGQVSYLLDRDDEGVVDDTFDALEDARVSLDDLDREIDRDTERRLEDLGYLR